MKARRSEPNRIYEIIRLFELLSYLNYDMVDLVNYEEGIIMPFSRISFSKTKKFLLHLIEESDLDKIEKILNKEHVQNNAHLNFQVLSDTIIQDKNTLFKLIP